MIDTNPTDAPAEEPAAELTWSDEEWNSGLVTAVLRAQPWWRRAARKAALRRTELRRSA